MSLGIRGKLFLLAALMIAAVVGIAGVFVERSIEGTMRARQELELARHAKSTGVLLEQTQPGDYDVVADRAGEATRSEVWVFTPDGRAVGSSVRAPLELEQLVAPSRDPEVQQALRSGRGVATRVDAAGVEHLFLALKVAAPGGAVIARASAPVPSVGETLSEIRIAVVAAGLAGMVIVGGLLAAVGSQVERALQPVVSSAAAAKVAESKDAESQHGDDGPQSLRTVAVDLERTMDALSSERNRFEAVLQTLEQAVLVLGADDRVVTVNRAAYSLLSLPEQVVGRTLLETECPGSRRWPMPRPRAEATTMSSTCLRADVSMFEPSATPTRAWSSLPPT